MRVHVCVITKSSFSSALSFFLLPTTELAQLFPLEEMAEVGLLLVFHIPDFYLHCHRFCSTDKESCLNTDRYTDSLFSYVTVSQKGCCHRLNNTNSVCTKTSLFGVSGGGGGGR